ncbi:MAG TPA: hypothetical protein VJT32_10990 [bacterium]|nr:hypothetical protein [bacterium]
MTVPSGILDHIRHAEGWLRRAREDCAHGDAHRVVLRLLLAEAEIRRARESGVFVGADAARPRRPRWMILGAVVASGLLVLAGYAIGRSQLTGPAASAPAAAQAVPAAQDPAGIVRFENAGVLPLVGFPATGSSGRSAPASLSGFDILQGGDPLTLPPPLGSDGSDPATSK